MAELFNPRTINKLCQDVILTEEQKKNAKKWLKLLKEEKLREEQNNYIPFANIILEGILGYPVNNNDIFTHEKNNVEFQCKLTNNKTVCIETKGTKTVNLFQRQNYSKKEQSTPIKQLWGYMSDAEFGICTNYRLFILIIREYGTSRHHQFDFETISKDESKLKEFVYIFSKQYIENDFVINLQEQSVTEEKELTDEFYKLFHETRLMLIKEFHKGDVTKNMSILMAQIFLNRLIFWFFAEDRGFVSRKLFYNKIISMLNTKPTEYSKSVFVGINDMFTIFDKGSYEIDVFGFNGGLFNGEIPHNVYFNDLQEKKYFNLVRQNFKLSKFTQIDENTQEIIQKYHNLNPIISNLLLMESFDFTTDVNVNILGHIFEQSITDLEELQGNKESKRKKEGVYYTPEYITDYICRNTIIPHLSKSGKITDPYDLVDEYREDIKDLEKKFKDITICDPACGSGAFLVKAVDVLLDIHKSIQEYKELQGLYSGLDKWNEESEMRDIIENSIYGVDINREAVEISRLAMFFKTVSTKRKLPDLSKNILVGNSIISDKVNPNAFSWNDKFPEIFWHQEIKKNIDQKHENGFSIIIGNPPYVRQESLENKEQMQLSENSDLTQYKIPSKMDLSGYFFYHSLDILKNKGKIGFIASDSWMSFGYGKSLQQLLLDKCSIDVLMRTQFNVFEDADIRTVTTILKKSIDSNNTVKLIYAKKKEELLKADSKPISKRQPEFEIGNWIDYFAESKFIPRIEMVKLSDTGNVKRGKTTGCNDFFVLTKDVIEKYNIVEKYLKPIISNDIHFGLLEYSDSKEYLLNVNESKGKLVKSEDGKKVLKYIEHGEKTTITPKRGKNPKPCLISELSTVKNRNIWYSLNLKDADRIFLSQIIYKYVKVYENNDSFFTLDVFACFTPNNETHTHAFLAYFSSSYFSLCLEKNGHSMGGGALKFQIIDYKNALVPNFDRLSKKDLEKMSKAWLEYREDFDQKKLDDVICDVLGFTTNEQIKIREELQILIKQRIEIKKSK